MPRSFADKLNMLFDTVRRDDGSSYSLSDVAKAVSSDGRAKLSPSYLSELRTGRKESPNVWVANALAQFFGQPLEYFVDDALQPVAPTRAPRRTPVRSDLDLTTFAGRLAAVIAATQPAGGKGPDSKRLATQLADDGATVTVEQLDEVRGGRQDPEPELVAALAHHFDVPAAVLTDRSVAESLGSNLRFLNLIRDDKTRALALRATGLSAEDRDRVADLIDRLAGEKGVAPDKLGF